MGLGRMKTCKPRTTVARGIASYERQVSYLLQAAEMQDDLHGKLRDSRITVGGLDLVARRFGSPAREG